MKNMQFNKLIGALVISVSSMTIAASSFAATSEAKASYSAAKDAASAEYKTAKVKCNSLSGNAKDICVKEAEAARVHSVADADDRYTNTAAQHTKSRKKIANADYDVAKEKCDDKAGNEKDVCVKEAKAARTAAIADAKSDRKVTEARKDANEDKRDAEYKVASEKCESLAGAAKDACMRSAKTSYGK